MEITLVKVFPVHEDKLKAFVSIVIDNCFMVNDIKIIQGKDRLFLSMPSRRKKTGEFKDVAHPLNEETRNLLEERVLKEYWRAVEDEVDAEAVGTPTSRPIEVPLTPRAAAGGEPASAGLAEGSDSPAPGATPVSDGGASANSVVVAHPSARSGSSSSGSSSSDSSSSGSTNRRRTNPQGIPQRSDEEMVAAAGGEGVGLPGGERQGNRRVEAAELSLEEVQEKHLQDSFWSVR